VLHLLAGALAADHPAIGRHQAKRFHLRCPFLVVIAACRRFAESLLPFVRHLVQQDRDNVLIGLTDEPVRI
jgi:hypothetical protein